LENRQHWRHATQIVPTIPNALGFDPDKPDGVQTAGTHVLSYRATGIR